MPPPRRPQQRNAQGRQPQRQSSQGQPSQRQKSGQPQAGRPAAGRRPIARPKKKNNNIPYLIAGCSIIIFGILLIIILSNREKPQPVQTHTSKPSYTGTPLFRDIGTPGGATEDDEGFKQ